MLKKLLFLPALALGVLALVLLVRGRKAAGCRRPWRRSRTTSACSSCRASRCSREPLGYGVVRPGRVWQAVPQVGGRITEM